MIHQFDHLEIRCPKLGHPLNFSYCRSTQGDTPCPKIQDCWYQRIPIQKYVQEFFSPAVLSRLAEPPKPKILSILEIAQRAQATKKNGTIHREDLEL